MGSSISFSGHPKYFNDDFVFSFSNFNQDTCHSELGVLSSFYLLVLEFLPKKAVKKIEVWKEQLLFRKSIWKEKLLFSNKQLLFSLSKSTALYLTRVFNGIPRQTMNILFLRLARKSWSFCVGKLCMIPSWKFVLPGLINTNNAQSEAQTWD